MNANSLQVLVPVYNEAQSIAHVLTEIDETICRKYPAKLLVCEDGSTDGTQEVLAKIHSKLGFELHSSPSRKGYSRAVKEGLLKASAPWVLCLDSDGQCDPSEFEKFWNAKAPGKVVIGWRAPRRDPWIRRATSGFFKIFFKLVYPVGLHDPSCPMVLIPHSVLNEIVPGMGAMELGFWWEFVARCHLRGIPLVEISVNHRERFAGESSIYKFRRMPGIFIRHFLALFKIRTSQKAIGRSVATLTSKG